MIQTQANFNRHLTVPVREKWVGIELNIGIMLENSGTYKTYINNIMIIIVLTKQLLANIDNAGGKTCRPVNIANINKPKCLHVYRC